MNDYGRPTKYDPAHCALAEEYLGGGHSVSALAGLIGVTKPTIYEWIKQYPEFSDSVKVGQMKAVGWWESRLKSIAEGADGNATAAIFGLKNRAADDWSDKQQHEHTGTVSVTIQKFTAQ